MEDHDYIDELIEDRYADLNFNLDSSKDLVAAANMLLKKSKTTIKKVETLQEEIKFLTSRKLKLSPNSSREKTRTENQAQIYEQIENKLGEFAFNLYASKELVSELLQAQSLGLVLE